MLPISKIEGKCSVKKLELKIFQIIQMDGTKTNRTNFFLTIFGQPQNLNGYKHILKRKNQKNNNNNNCGNEEYFEN